jgi:hypothetical protein
MEPAVLEYASCLMNGLPGGRKTEKSLKRSKKVLDK